MMKAPQLLMVLRREEGGPHEPEELPRPQRIHVQNFSHVTEFGWGFPEVDEAAVQRRKVDLSWIHGYDREIGRLRAEVKRQKALSCSSLGAEEVKMPPKGPLVLQGESVASEQLGPDSAFVTDTKSDRVAVSGTAAEDFRSESPPATPHSEACFSVRSFTSKDSGVYAADDTSECSPEVPPDRSFLEELEDLSDQDISADNSFCRSETDKSETDKFPLCFQKSDDDMTDLSVKLSYLSWKSCSASPSESLCSSTMIFRDSLADESSQSLEDTRRQRLRGLWTACDRLEAKALRGGAKGSGVTEVMQLVASLSKLDDRLRLLRCDLDSLMLQARENMSDFGSLQTQACRLASRTEGSRLRLAQAVGLEKVCSALEERLHEEWWAAHCPNLLPEHENYIV